MSALKGRRGVAEDAGIRETDAGVRGERAWVCWRLRSAGRGRQAGGVWRGVREDRLTRRKAQLFTSADTRKGKLRMKETCREMLRLVKLPDPPVSFLLASDYFL